MKLRKTLAAAGALAITAGMFASQPASAVDDATPTVVTLTLAASGNFSIDAPATASAGPISNAAGTLISISIGDTTVVDERGSLLGWAATAAATDFEYTDGDSNTFTIPAATLTWTTGTIAAAGSASTLGVLPAAGAMVSPFAVAAAAPLRGSGTFTYPATISGVVPPNMAAGDYTATVTQSVI